MKVNAYLQLKVSLNGESYRIEVSALEQKILMNIQLDVICVNTVQTWLHTHIKAAQLCNLVNFKILRLFNFLILIN